MKINWDKFLGRSPLPYARNIISACGFRHPPICEKTITDYLKIPVKEFGESDFREFAGDNPETLALLKKKFQKTCAWLRKEPNGKSFIRLFGEMLDVKKRVSVGHECGHDVLPWHSELDYFDYNSGIDSSMKKRSENEAFTFGSEMLMPRKFFLPDILDSKMSFSSIGQLKKRYFTSFEVTAIWYARTNPFPCALMMVEPMDETIQNDNLDCESSIQFDFPYHKKNIDNNYPLRVKYFVKSNLFPKYIPAGTPIGYENRIYDAWKDNIEWEGEIRSSELNSSAKLIYHAECRPVRNTKMIMVLLFPEFKQSSFDFYMKEIE